MKESLKPQKRLYSVSEAAIYLGSTEWSVRHLIWGGKLPQVRVGRRVFVDMRDMDALIDKNKIIEASLVA